MVAKAKEELEQELEEKEEQKAKYLEEKSPPLHTSGMSLAELQVSSRIQAIVQGREPKPTCRSACCLRRNYARSCTPK